SRIYPALFDSAWAFMPSQKGKNLNNPGVSEQYSFSTYKFRTSTSPISFSFYLIDPLLFYLFVKM
ncbi:MAG: hypothetical protein U9P79_06975, partial [Candidatus Cloacimonadota bacterium]|nr:hypothetical protein [Candidatus Cloacimonadota bacterium]